LEHSLSEARDIPSGLLRINSPLGFSRRFLGPEISAFKAQYPKVEVQLILADAALNLVELGLDLGIRFGPPPDSRLVMRVLMRNRRFLCAAPSYLARRGVPRTLQDLKNHNCIVLRQDHDAYDVWRFDEVDGEFPSAKVTGDLSTNDGEIALGWVLEGHGIMLRSEWDIARHVREGRLRVVLADYQQSAPLCAVYPERHNLSAKVRRFVDHLADTLNAKDKSEPMALAPGDIYSD
jgi:DNA-binding transcriptional LysR family regulator